MHVYMLLICPHRDKIIPGGYCSTSAWLKSSWKTWYLFSLVISLSFSSEATITQIIFSHAKPLLTTLSQLFLGVGSNFCLPSYEGEHRYLQCVLGLPSLLYVSFTSADTQSLHIAHFKCLLNYQ